MKNKKTMLITIIAIIIILILAFGSILMGEYKQALIIVLVLGYVVLTYRLLIVDVEK